MKQAFVPSAVGKALVRTVEHESRVFPRTLQWHQRLAKRIRRFAIVTVRVMHLFR